MQFQWAPMCIYLWLDFRGFLCTCTYSQYESGSYSVNPLQEGSWPSPRPPEATAPGPHHEGHWDSLIETLLLLWPTECKSFWTARSYNLMMSNVSMLTYSVPMGWKPHRQFKEKVVFNEISKCSSFLKNTFIVYMIFCLYRVFKFWLSWI